MQVAIKYVRKGFSGEEVPVRTAPWSLQELCRMPKPQGDEGHKGGWWGWVAGCAPALLRQDLAEQQDILWCFTIGFL